MISLWRKLLVLVWCLPLAGCYLLQAAQGQLSLAAKRQPIATVIANPQTKPTLRTRLEYVQAARSFASSQLGLPDNASYTSYVDLQRRYVLWNVFATPEFSVEPTQWCFPIAGCVVYRGYFNERAAERFALQLRANGHDAAVSGVPAYSTLGHFADPVMSSMLEWSDAQVAATLFHELAHQVLYVKDDSAFNEAFATAVEATAIERWLTAQHQLEQLQRWRIQRQRSVEFSALLLATRDQLRELYASPVPRAEMRDRKQQLFGELKFKYLLLKQSWNGYSGYDTWFKRRLSNADFIAIATYQSCVPAFERLLHSVDDDLPRFYAAVRELARQNKLTRQQLCGP